MIIIKSIILLLFYLLIIILFIHYKLKKRLEIEPIQNEIPFELDKDPQINNILNRNKISLNGKWNYIIDVQEVGYYNYRMNPNKNGFFKNEKPKNPQDLIEYDFDKSPEMEIPSDWNTIDEKLFFYEGTVWFKKAFNYNKKPEKKAFLYFGAVNYEAIVYVNQNLVGRHIGGFTPFNFDITDKLNQGENYIVIKVNNQRKPENIPSLIFDWWNYGGITRDVYIIETDNIFIQYYSLLLDKKEINGPNNILFNAELNLNISDKIIEVSIPELKIKQKFTSLNGKFSGVIKVNEIILWSPENPKIYNIDLIFENKTLKDEIGFRIIETSGKKILLNGKPIFLRGISIHEEKYNGGGRANSIEDARKLLGWAKELECNFVRLAHYPHNEYMVREAEKMGIMVWSEIPIYWGISWENNNTFQNANNQLANMIRRDINRVNIIIWSIANETPKIIERDKFLSKLAKQARYLDSTRLISMAMQPQRKDRNNFILEDNMNEYVDIISINQYLGWYNKIKNFNRISLKIPYNKPIIITEFGGGAKYGYHGNENKRWTEEFQKNVYINNLQLLEKIDGLVGTSPWILKDFRSPRRVLNGIQDYYNRKGLFSDKGEKKEAFFVMKEWYNKKKEEYK